MKIKSILILFLTTFLNLQPTLYSAEQQHVDSAKQLAATKIDPFLAFLLPIITGQTDIAIAAIKKPENKPFINQQRENGDTALLLACKAKNPVMKIVEALLQEGADARIKNATGDSAINFVYNNILFLTTKYDPHAFSLLKLLINPIYSAEKAYWEKLDGLLPAIINDDTRAVQDYINLVDDPNQIVIFEEDIIKKQIFINSLLGYAITHYATKVVKMLINNKQINTNLIQNEKGLYLTCAALFLVKMNDRNVENETNFKIIQKLIQNTEHINEICFAIHNTTLLGLAISLKKLEIINACLKHLDIDINRVDFSDKFQIWTPTLRHVINISHENLNSYITQSLRNTEPAEQYSAINLKIFTLLLNVHTIIPLDINLNDSLTNLLIDFIETTKALEFLKALAQKYPTIVVNHLLKLAVNDNNLNLFLSSLPKKDRIADHILQSVDSKTLIITPLMLAIILKNTLAVQLLLNFNANLMLPNETFNALTLIEALLRKNPRNNDLLNIKTAINKKRLEHFQETINAETQARTNILQEEQAIIDKETALLENLQRIKSSLEQTIDYDEVQRRKQIEQEEMLENVIINSLEHQKFNAIQKELKKAARAAQKRLDRQDDAQSSQSIVKTVKEKPKSPESPLIILQLNQGMPTSPTEASRIKNFLDPIIQEARSKIPVTVQVIRKPLFGMNNIHIDWDHIFNVNYKVDAATNKITFVGGHYAPSIRKFIQTTLVKSGVSEITDNATGIIQFRFTSTIDNTPFIKTTFPDGWNMETIAETIFNSTELLREEGSDNIIIFVETKTTPSIILRCIFYIDPKKVIHLTTIIPLSADSLEYQNLQQTSKPPLGAAKIITPERHRHKNRTSSTASPLPATPKSSHSYAGREDESPLEQSFRPGSNVPQPAPIHRISSKRSIDVDFDNAPSPAAAQLTTDSSTSSSVNRTPKTAKTPKSAKKILEKGID